MLNKFPGYSAGTLQCLGVGLRSLALTNKFLSDGFFFKEILGVSGNSVLRIGSCLVCVHICSSVSRTFGMCVLYVSARVGVVGGLGLFFGL